jgi:hypothetical protein
MGKLQGLSETPGRPAVPKGSTEEGEEDLWTRKTRRTETPTSQQQQGESSQKQFSEEEVNQVSKDLIYQFSLEVEEFKGGCIRNRFDVWSSLTSDPEILQTVIGLPIDLIGEVPESNSFQYPLSIEGTEFLKEEIQRLLIKGIIIRSYHEEGELISPIFLRPKSDGDGFRLILNLKRLNEVSEYHHFKMETLKSILTLVYPGVYMMKLDIKDAYYSVYINKVDQKLLKFQFMDTLYQFVALPNGYTGGPRKFTKLLKPVLATLRKKGISLAAYLDDLIIFGASFFECWTNFLDTVELLRSLGFVIHPKKTTFMPSTCTEFLGFIIDSILMTVTLTLEKKQHIISMCDAIIHGSSSASIRDIAKLLGKISSSFIGVPLGRLHHRHLEKAKTCSLKMTRGNYDGRINLTHKAYEEIYWWKNNITKLQALF